MTLSRTLLLVGLALAAAPVSAQSLTLGSGDTITVSSAGTVGTIGGTPVSNSTTHYSAPPPGTGSSNSAVFVGGTAAFNLSGGSLASVDEQGIALNITGSGPVTVSGGAIYGGHGVGLEAAGTGAVLISGGTFSNVHDGVSLVVNKGSTVQVTGGLFQFQDFLPQPYPTVIYVAGTLNLFSFNDSPFLINGVAMNNTSLTNIPQNDSGNTISGTLANGDKLNTFFTDYGIINLNPGVPAAVPEASTTVSFGLLFALGLGGVCIAKKRKSAQSML